MFFMSLSRVSCFQSLQTPVHTFLNLSVTHMSHTAANCNPETMARSQSDAIYKFCPIKTLLISDFRLLILTPRNFLILVSHHADIAICFARAECISGFRLDDFEFSPQMPTPRSCRWGLPRFHLSTAAFCEISPAICISMVEYNIL